MRVVDTFAGPGGWDRALVDLGFVGTVVGLEWDGPACDTAAAAGHLRVQADVAQYPPSAFAGFDGLIASPPCQAFSLAGKCAGLGVVDRMLAHVWSCRDGWVDPPDALCSADVRADLTLQPLRWADAIRPDWIALEQVPGVLPLWRAIAAVFEMWGYSTAVTVLNAADFGVPQTRKRAVLVASRSSVAQMPEATHFDPRKGGSLWGEPWVSMAEGLSWTGTATVDRRQNGAPVVSADAPSPTVTAAAFGKGVWKITPGEGWGFTDRPAPTVIAGPGGKSTWAEWGGSAIRGRMYDAQDTPEWAHKRPATTVLGDPRVGRPGHKDRTTNGEPHFAADSIRVSVAEAGVLQSFPPDYPWQGSKTKRHEQVGNAIPPRLAAAVLAPLVADHCRGVAV